MNNFELFPHRRDLMPETFAGVAALQGGFASGSMLNFLSCVADVDVNAFYQIVKDYNIESDMLVNSAGQLVRYSGEQILWQTDASGSFRDVRVLFYDENTGYVERRDEYQEQQLRRGIDYAPDGAFFGGDLPTKHPDKPVCVVQNEMTATLAAAALPDKTWVAVGYAKNLTAAALKTILARRIILYPDEMAVDWWRDAAREVPGVSISTFFAGIARPENDVLIKMINERKSYAN